MSEKDLNYIIIYPESHQHLGLFDDLNNLQNVEIFIAKQTRIQNQLLNIIRKVHTSWSINKHINLPLKKIWYEKIDFSIKDDRKYCIIVVDSALKMLNVKTLNQLFSRDNVRGVLVLVNSIDAQSVSMLEIKDDLFKVRWNDIFSFDPGDVKKYHLKELGCCYYSMKAKSELSKVAEKHKITSSDIYFSGGFKGGRKNLILKIFKLFLKSKVDAKFEIMLAGKQRVEEKPFEDKIHYFSGGWIPYENVLAATMKSNVILEILQNNQMGPSLRYYEAVCYNKKLLTNNPEIIHFPFYDERYMKVFKSVDEVDLDWIKKKEEIDYHYDGSFSPVHMLKLVLQ